ncbi:YciI family protein [Amnibacterium kyonggiense]|uniref:YCII-related domain-containing protein n=1 Tax=Amnibacterium kyonggiense TaxID=595671 RepID=A0A4R7FLE4_9MICO|nr:YciI family protein [Amnibacterium kyonggiense]TDS77188.1 hypothetical protein CLV52_2128 [Amnibacterium kyonggiense]
MQYVMLVRVDPELAATTATDDVEPWVEEGARRGLRVQGAPVEDPEAATTVRVREGEVLLSDGPFAETKEVVAGYDLLEAPDLATAVDYATRHPVAAIGALEVREVWEDFVAPREAPAREPRTDGRDYLFLHVPDPEVYRRLANERLDPTEWVRRVEDEGVTLGGARLRDEADASATVRSRDGEVLVTRGPFAELGEQIAGIDLVRAADLDEAIALAAAHPTSIIGAIEVRPFPAR